jgi:hypothetical protein
MVGAEFIVVANKVKMSFWPQENVSVNVKPGISSKMAQEMGAARIVRATRETAIYASVKADVFTADSGHHICTESFTEPLPKNAVEIVKNWAEGDFAEPTHIEKILTGAPCDLAIESKMVFHENIGPDAGIQAATDGLRKMVGISTARRGGQQSAESDSHVRLLSPGQTLQQEEPAKHSDYRYLSHFTLRCPNMMIKKLGSTTPPEVGCHGLHPRCTLLMLQKCQRLLITKTCGHFYYKPHIAAKVVRPITGCKNSAGE